MQDNLAEMTNIKAWSDTAVGTDGNASADFHPLPPQIVGKHDELTNPGGQVFIVQIPSGSITGTGPEALVEQ